ncbi:nitroreductase family protein [Amphibacillus marinus]|uniref:nitroreductase family protein n=1 Tax=Amphibacillus marinus TaxID=872970 RepID=UPI00115FC701|nr:nitroreductase family protein [Amphibacillus marinus]
MKHLNKLGGVNVAKDFLKAVEDRRSIYVISNEKVVPEERIEEVVKFAVKHTPYSFNATSGRVVVLFGEEHNKLWELAKDELRKIVPVENFADTEGRIDGFKAGYGTVLFFEDQEVVKGLQEQMALYKDNFPIWSEQASGMLQFVVWTALENEGLGATLQHYNPLIDEGVKQHWHTPDSWVLRAQMPFGKPEIKAGEKEFQPLEERVKVFK